MRVRAITIGQIVPFLYENESLESFLEEKLENFQNFLDDFTETLENEYGLKVQSRRLASQPLFSYEEQRIYSKNLKDTLNKIDVQFELMQNIINAYNFDYFACCSMLADTLKDFSVFESLLLKSFPKFLQKYPMLFTSVLAASSKNGVNLAALKAGADVIKNLSTSDPFNNLQFCVSANVKPNTPFFPSAYHFSDEPAFSLALEMADEVARTSRGASSVVDAKNALVEKFDNIYEGLTEFSEKFAKKYEIEFAGIDFSPAPFPKLTRSIGYAVEKLNIDYFGAHGSLLPIALIKRCIPKKEKVIGFSGFMMPVMEDYTISKRLAENKFTLDTLLLFSTMCGTGLDCVPLPGDITKRELFYILLDMCTLSIILDKPLTARLMPIPGKKAGDDIDFDFEYFASTKVIEFKRLEKENLKDLFNGKEKFFHFY